MIKKFFTVLAAIAMLALSACTQEEINQFLNPINSIKLDQTQVEMNVGETLLLFATVDPFKGDTKVVSWTSSSPDVASVKGTEVPDVAGINMPAGEVTALKEGETTITAKTVLTVNGNTWEIAHVLVSTRQLVEKRCLATILVSHQGKGKQGVVEC